MTYLFTQILVGHDDDIRGISNSSGGSPDVSEDDLSNQDVSGVQIKHLTQSRTQKSQMVKNSFHFIS